MFDSAPSKIKFAYEEPVKKHSEHIKFKPLKEDPTKLITQTKK